MPLKRHPALQRLSREHQRLLLEAQALRWIIEGDARARLPAEVFARLRATWEELGAAHLDREEQVLFPALLARAPEEAPMVERLLLEHDQIRAGIARAGELDADGLRALSALLHDHVRYEERVLYPCVQEAFDEQSLQALGERLDTDS